MRGHGTPDNAAAAAARSRPGPGPGPGPVPPARAPGPACPANQTASKMWQCTCCRALFHTFKNAKAHLRHNVPCLRRVSERAARERKDTGRFVFIDALGIIEVKFNTRSNFVGGAVVVSREGREFLKNFRLRWIQYYISLDAIVEY
jgi:hypothetical protein